MDNHLNHPSEPFRRGTKHLFSERNKPRPARRSELRAAIAALTEHLKAHPGDLAGLAGRAVALLEKLDFASDGGLTDARQAEGDLTHVLAAKPGVSDVWKARGWVRSQLGEKAEGKEREMLLRGAIDDLRESIRLEKQSAWCHRTLGQSIIFLAGLIRREPEKIALLREARSALVEARRLDPQDHEAAYSGTTAAVMLAAEFITGPSTEALETLPACLREFEEALQRQPDRIDLHMNYATALGLLGVAKAVRKQDPVPDFERALGAFCVALTVGGNARAGVEVFAHTLQFLFRESPDLLERPRLLGQYHYILGLFVQVAGDDPTAEWLRALPLLEEAVRRQPEVASIRAWLGMTFRELGRLEEALCALEEALRRMPDDESLAKAIERIKAMR